MPMLSGDKLLSLIDALGGIVWEAELETFRFVFVSAGAERILGFPVRTWLEEPDFWVRHTHPDDVERCARPIRHTVRDRVTPPVHLRATCLVLEVISEETEERRDPLLARLAGRRQSFPGD